MSAGVADAPVTDQALASALHNVAHELARLPFTTALGLLSSVAAALIHDHMPKALDLGSVQLHAIQVQRNLESMRTTVHGVH